MFSHPFGGPAIGAMDRDSPARWMNLSHHHCPDITLLLDNPLLPATATRDPLQRKRSTSGVSDGPEPSYSLLIE